GYYDGSDTTPFQVYDLTTPTAPHLAGTVVVPGMVWNILPAPGSRIFALGNSSSAPYEGDPVSVHYLDVTDPATPKLLGTSKFGEGWAWTPAAGTFKAFTMDASKGLVVLPFSGWDTKSGNYNNGLQLIEFSPTTLTTAGPAHTRGWVERGIFVGNRLVSLSDISLAVVDYSDPMSPSVVTELTLARNVITALPAGDRLAEVSSDWWDNDTTTSQVRMLPVDNAEETADVGAPVPSTDIEGVNARVFRNGQLAYVVTTVRTDEPCPGTTGGPGQPGGYEGCFVRAQQVQVVDLSGATPTVRGKLRLPGGNGLGGGWGWYGFWWYDWWWGDEVVQVGGDVLAFRRWQPIFDSRGSYLDANSELQIVDLAAPDAPRVASTVIQTDAQAWWGNIRVVGDTLYTTHYEWLSAPADRQSTVKYYLDAIDLGDRAHPRVRARINVPGMLVGGDASNPNIIYTMDYRWTGDSAVNDFDVLEIQGSRARLLATTTIDGWVGQTIVRGKQAYLSAQRYTSSNNGSLLHARVDLHALDISNPNRIRDRVVSDTGWGWLLAVEGDRALVTSGWWGEQAIDVYQLRDGRAPSFDQTIRTRGWWVNGVARQDQTLFLSSGYWGVQKVDLQ
ncbi:MAG TPA: beta-propeller domain-containing protein, partial [Kofleriaceae bacterium]|nr:beta-propeller domain-containing protein [Kofleriaceae bacterium]